MPDSNIIPCRFCNAQIKYISNINGSRVYKCTKCNRILMSDVQHDITETLKKIWLEEDIKKDFIIP